MNEHLETPVDPVQVDAGVIVATIRLRERRGSAIGVCEYPPVLELGISAGQVIERMKERLLLLIAATGGAPQLLLVIRDDNESVSTEALR